VASLLTTEHASRVEDPFAGFPDESSALRTSPSFRVASALTGRNFGLRMVIGQQQIVAPEYQQLGLSKT